MSNPGVVVVVGGARNKADKKRAIRVAGLAQGGGTLAADMTITVPKATFEQVAAGLDDASAITPVKLASALAGFKVSGAYVNAPNVSVSGVPLDQVIANLTASISAGVAIVSPLTFTNAYTAARAAEGRVNVPNGDYTSQITSPVAYPGDAVTQWWTIDPRSKGMISKGGVGTASPSNGIPGGPTYIGNPGSYDFISKTFSGSEWSGTSGSDAYGVFVRNTCVYNTSTGPRAVVALASVAVARGGAVWAFNPGAYWESGAVNAITAEVDCGALNEPNWINGLSTTGDSYGLVIAGSGSYGARCALQIQASGPARMQTAIGLNSQGGSSGGCVKQYAINMTKLTDCQYGIDAELGVFNITELRFPSLRVAATPRSDNFTSTVRSRVCITAGSSSTNALIQLEGAGPTPATNDDLYIRPLGTGRARLQDSTGANGIDVSSAGIAFTVVARRAITGSKSSGAALASVIAGLVAGGLYSDSTTT